MVIGLMKCSSENERVCSVMVLILVGKWRGVWLRREFGMDCVYSEIVGKYSR